MLKYKIYSLGVSVAPKLRRRTMNTRIRTVFLVSVGIMSVGVIVPANAHEPQRTEITFRLVPGPLSVDTEGQVTDKRGTRDEWFMTETTVNGIRTTSVL